MKNKTILITILALILVGTLSFLYSYVSPILTGDVIEEVPHYYTYTKAICTETNLCQDYEIVCDDKKLIEANPITGAIVQNPSNWEDPREDKIINGFCNVSSRE